MDLSEYNVLAILLAAAAAFGLGAIWYSKQAFGEMWMKETGVTEESAKSMNVPKVMGLAFLLTLLAAAVFSLFLGPKPNFFFALGAGISSGLCWVTAAMGIHYLFEGKSLKLFLINGGYNTAMFTIFGIVLGIWH
ncbi:MAG: DUF1761 domain-containing protein [Gammaproteobacteria bacterium]|nr:DUF1761 domain-containing protein [Gammaproteobacteria bacterium]